MTQRITEKASELLPCPFCGGKPEIDDLGDADSFYVRCTACEVQQIAVHYPDGAVTVWNTRAALPHLQHGEWQPIETAPKDIVFRYSGGEYGERVLLYCGEVIRGRWWQSDRADWRKDGYQNFLADGGLAVRPTHWMPMPAAPLPSHKHGEP